MTDIVSPLLTCHDGSLAFGAWRRSQAGLCDPLTGAVFRRFPLPHPSTYGYSLAVSPDGKAMVLTKRDGSKGIEMWEVATGQVRDRIDANTSKILAVAWSPAGRILATGGSDAVIRFWDLITGREIGRLEGHQGPIRVLAFLPKNRLVSGSTDSTLLVWKGPFGTAAKEEANDLADGQLDSLWKSLSAKSATEAYRAMRQLAGAPDRSLPILQERLRPTPAPDMNKLKRWIADLDSEQFAVRQKATLELEALGQLAAPALREVLGGRPGPEVKQRVRELLARISRREMSPEVLRAWRAVEILELLGTNEAIETLKKLSKGAPGIVTRDARRALKRLPAS